MTHPACSREGMTHTKTAPNPEIKRYKNIPRSNLPDDFPDRPADVLAELAADYEKSVRDTHGRLVDKYHDWAVRVELDPANALSVAELHTDQQGKWVEFRGVMKSAGQPRPKAVSLAWTCVDCDNVMMFHPKVRPYACVCKSRNIYQNNILSTFVDSRRVLLKEDAPKGKPGGLCVLECSLDGTLVNAFDLGKKYVVGGVLQIASARNGRRNYRLMVNNLEALPPPDKEGVR